MGVSLNLGGLCRLLGILGTLFGDQGTGHVFPGLPPKCPALNIGCEAPAQEPTTVDLAVAEGAVPRLAFKIPGARDVTNPCHLSYKTGGQEFLSLGLIPPLPWG